ASWRVSRLNIVRAIRDLPEPGTQERSRDVLVAGILVALGGLGLTLWGFALDTGMGKIPGPPVLALGLGIVAASRGWARAAMTLAMFALILFMVTLISMLQGLQAASLDSFVQQQSGGYDVIAYTTSYGEIPNFRQRLQENFSESLFAGGWNGTSSASVMPAKVQTVGGNRTYDYTLWGVDNFLIQSNQYGFTSYLPSYVNESSGARETLATREQ